MHIELNFALFRRQLELFSYLESLSNYELTSNHISKEIDD